MCFSPVQRACHWNSAVVSGVKSTSQLASTAFSGRWLFEREGKESAGEPYYCNRVLYPEGSSVPFTRILFWVPVFDPQPSIL